MVSGILDFRLASLSLQVEALELSATRRRSSSFEDRHVVEAEAIHSFDSTVEVNQMIH